MHEHPIKVHFEDLDMGGVVFHPNYLCYLERARSQFLRDKGYDFKKLIQMGIGVAVVKHLTEYQKPAFLEDDLLVKTEFVGLKGAFVKVNQNIEKDGSTIYKSSMLLAFISLKTMKLSPAPEDFLEHIGLNELPEDIEI